MKPGQLTLMPGIYNFRSRESITPGRERKVMERELKSERKRDKERDRDGERSLKLSWS